MTTTIYTANKTRSKRPGWSVTFNHPRRTDARGKGLKVRRGLGTTDDAEADQLVAQLNALLADPNWWSLDRRAEAEQQFSGVIVAAFFDGIEVGKVKSKELREKTLPLPTSEDGYARVMLVGATGAGKTTLLRHLIGSDHKRDRFPSTSTAKTTTAEIEIITGTGPFQAAITFMTEFEVRCAVDECLEAACESVVREHSDERIAAALLEHREQRFRLSYLLGNWPQPQPRELTDDEYDMDFDDPVETAETEPLSDDEIVGSVEINTNNERLNEYVGRIRDVATAVGARVTKDFGPFRELDDADDRQVWLEYFVDALYENQGFGRLSLDIMDVLAERFKLVGAGRFEASPTGWPTIWHYEELNRHAFLKQVRWFSSNHAQQFGRLLTPLVDGVRVRGPFEPSAKQLQRDENWHLVMLDGEGLGHSAKEATSVSTKVTEKFTDVDMILLVDTSQSPLQAASLELLRSVGTSGHGPKLAVAFTHFDQVKGDNLRGYPQKKDHVRASIGNAVAGLRETLSAPVAETLEKQLASEAFFLSGLDRPTDDIPGGFVKEMRRLMELMQRSAEPDKAIHLIPEYNFARLELVLSEATRGFKEPWLGRLGLRHSLRIPKEHWTRVKALCRRIANRWDNDEYDGLRPVADLVRQLMESTSRLLDDPSGWRTREPVDENERQMAIDEIRKRVFTRILALSERRLITNHPTEWRTAFAHRGTGSSRVRAKEMSGIYEEAAPSITSELDPTAEKFLNQVTQIVSDAIEEADSSTKEVDLSFIPQL